MGEGMRGKITSGRSEIPITASGTRGIHGAESQSRRASQEAPPSVVARVAMSPSKPLVGRTMLKKYQTADRSTSSGEKRRSAAEAKKKACEVMKVKLTSTSAPKIHVTARSAHGSLRASALDRVNTRARKAASRQSEPRAPTGEMGNTVMPLYTARLSTEENQRASRKLARGPFIAAHHAAFEAVAKFERAA